MLGSGLGRGVGKPLIFASCQVMSDWKGQAPTPIEDMSSGDGELFRQGEAARLKEMFAAELSRDEEHSKQLMTSKFKAERVATREFVAALDKSLILGVGWGLAEFIPRRPPAALQQGERRYISQIVPPAKSGPPQPRACIVDKDGNTRLEVPRVMLAGRAQYPVLHLAMDQCSVGWSGGLWLCLAQKLRMTLAMDPLHRLHNDWVGAVCSTGLALIRLEFRLVCRMRLGPFSSQGHLGTMRAIAREFFSLHSVENSLWQVLYDDLVRTNLAMVNMAGEGSLEAQQRAWEWCAEEAEVIGLGERCETGRWFSFESQSRMCYSARFLDLLLLLYLETKRKWWRSMAESPLLAKVMACSDTGETPLLGDTDAQQQGAGGDQPPEQGGGGEREDDNMPMTIGAARKAASDRRQGVHTLHHCCRLLCEHIKVRLWGGLCWLTNPLECFFGIANTNLREPVHVEALHIRLVEGAIHDLIREQLVHFESQPFARHCDMISLQRRHMLSAEIDQDRKVANAMWELNLKLIGNLSGTQAVYQAPPFSFIGLLTQDDARRLRCLARLKQEWLALVRLEEAAASDDEAAKFVTSLLAPQMVFVRETFLRLYEVDFQSVPPDLKADLTDFARSHLSTLMVEQAFNESRRVAAHNRAGRQEGTQLWHLTTMGGQLGENFGRPTIKPSPAAKAASSGKLPKCLFTGGAVDGSISNDKFEELVSPRPTWPTPSPASFKAAALAWQVVRATEGEWARNKNSWLSLLMTPGTIVLHNMSQHAKMVLEPCAPCADRGGGGVAEHQGWSGWQPGWSHAIHSESSLLLLSMAQPHVERRHRVHESSGHHVT